MPAAIETTGLTKRYGSARGIEAVDLRVEIGEVFGFLGPNGAGKTTFIRTLMDFIRPTQGSAKVFGLDSRLDSVEIHRRVGYLPGDLSLYDRLTGKALLEWFGSLRRTTDHGYRDELVERFAVELHRPIRDLSKGNRQKIGLVQAFMHRPDLVVLDEPTSGLDPLMQDAFHHLLREFTQQGHTVFMSSHSLDEVDQVADRVAIIREGRIVAVDAVQDLEMRAVRYVDIRLTDAPDDRTREQFAQIPGVSTASIEGDTFHLTVSGSLGAVVKHAATLDVVDFLSRPADLDEIFLTYYRDGESAEPS